LQQHTTDITFIIIIVVIVVVFRGRGGNFTAQKGPRQCPLALLIKRDCNDDVLFNRSVRTAQ